MTWTRSSNDRRDDRGDESPVNVLKLRIMELLAFLAVVVVAREIAGFNYSPYLFLLFPVAAALHVGGERLCTRLAARRGWSVWTANRVLEWSSSVLDLLGVLGIIYGTGGIGSPFLLLLAVPLFFARHILGRTRVAILFLAATTGAVALVGYLEIRGVIPHHNCYPFDDRFYLDGNFYVGSLLVLCAFLSLILFLASAFQDRSARAIGELRRKDREFEDRIKELSRLYDISLGINAVMTLETLLKMVAKEATMLTSRPWASIVLFNSNREITHMESVGAPETGQNAPGTNGRIGPLTEWIADTGRRVIVDDVRTDRRADEEVLFKGANVRSAVGCPLDAGHRVIGVVYVGDAAPGAIEDKHVRLLSIVCDQLVIAIAKSTLYESLRRKIDGYEKKVGELEKVNQLKLEYVSHVSHELRTPLTSIKAYVETITQHLDNPDFKEKRAFLDIVGKETERLIRVVNDILSVSNIEFGERPLSRQPLAVREIVEEVANTLKPKLDEKNIKLEVTIPDDLPRIDADRDLTIQMFINLIANAVKYSPQGTTVHVHGREVAVNVELTIEDQGIGIPAASVERIFERYYRVKSAQSRMADGIGLGLAIVKNIIERHGGTIRVESEENVGSKFIIALPKEHCGNDPLGFLSELISSKTDLHEMLNLIVRMIAELLSAKIISLMLLDRTRSELFIKISYGLEEWIVEQARVKVGEGIAGKVAETGKPLLIDNIEKNDVHSAPNNPQYETRSLLSAPLIVNGVVVGVINVNNKISGRPFDQDDLNLLMSFGERISKALERFRTAEDAGIGLRDTVEALEKLVEKQVETKAIEKIVMLTMKTARKLRLNEKEVKVLQYVASVHDIGMTKISDEILNKTFNLTLDEIKEIRRHPQEGTDLMRPLEFVELVSNITLYHHERVDGLGYPVGLKGDQIPLGARILAVIDAYQSMMAAKPYRKPRRVIEAARELVECSGHQFDKTVVEVFIEVLVDEGTLSKQQALEFKKTLHEVVISPSYR